MKFSFPTLLLPLLPAVAFQAVAQQQPYDVYPEAEPPYYRIRYGGSEAEGELRFPVKYTVWIPESVKTLRGIVVHQHGCGEGSCLSGLTGAFDLHWQALAKKHGCALLSPSYEQPGDAECQLWCDPRNGSGAKFQQALVDLGEMSGHPELAEVPWALWGHSGGGHWAGGMLMLHPEKVAAVWLRSGVPLLEANPDRPRIKIHELPEAALSVPVMCNPGTKEGVTEKEGKFKGVWPANETFFEKLREQGALIGVAVDPLTSHECGNQRYFAIPWLDACLSARLPEKSGNELRKMPESEAWLTPLRGTEVTAAGDFTGEVATSVWLPSEKIARKYVSYITDTNVPDTTPPPAPGKLDVDGNLLTWTAEADLESGIERFLIERDGEIIASVPNEPRNRFGRPLFQGLQYSDTPEQPLVEMKFTDNEAEEGVTHTYRILSVNTVGLKSKSITSPSTSR